MEMKKPVRGVRTGWVHSRLLLEDGQGATGDVSTGVPGPLDEDVATFDLLHLEAVRSSVPN